MLAPGGRSLGVTVIFVLTASSTACISSHCFVVVPVTAGVVDLSAVERAEGVVGLPVPELGGVFPVSDIIGVDPLPATIVVVPLSDKPLG
jgi:hypothetical protein